MLGKLLPILLVVVGTSSGIGAGLALKPEAKAPDDNHDCVAPPDTEQADIAKTAPSAEKATPENTAFDYVKLNNQFVVPVVSENRVSSLVVLSISLEVTAGQTEPVYQMEPKVRDALLSVLFDHANAGGFNGTFTNANDMIILRDALREVAKKTLGGVVSDVLITDIVRQDV